MCLSVCVCVFMSPCVCLCGEFVIGAMGVGREKGRGGEGRGGGR